MAFLYMTIMSFLEDFIYGGGVQDQLDFKDGLDMGYRLYQVGYIFV